MTTPPPSPSPSLSPSPTAPPPLATGVWVPTNLFTAMASCYYGDGPRFGRARPEPSPLPTEAAISSPLENPGSLTPTASIKVSGFRPMGINARPAPNPDMMGGGKASPKPE